MKRNTTLYSLFIVSCLALCLTACTPQIYDTYHYAFNGQAKSSKSGAVVFFTICDIEEGDLALSIRPYDKSKYPYDYGLNNKVYYANTRCAAPGEYNRPRLIALHLPEGNYHVSWFQVNFGNYIMRPHNYFYPIDFVVKRGQLNYAGRIFLKSGLENSYRVYVDNYPEKDLPMVREIFPLISNQIFNQPAILNKKLRYDSSTEGYGSA